MATEKVDYIFLVDDEPIQNEMLKDFLSERLEDFKFKTFESGELALKEMNQNPHIVVLDYHLNSHLPDQQNGVEILKAIKERHPQVQVIMLSGQDKIEVAVESMKYGASDYVIKGETAFSRMENVINRIVQFENMKKANRNFKAILTSMVVALVFIILLSIFLLVKFGA